MYLSKVLFMLCLALSASAGIIPTLFDFDVIANSYDHCHGTELLKEYLDQGECHTFDTGFYGLASQWRRHFKPWLESASMYGYCEIQIWGAGL